MFYGWSTFSYIIKEQGGHMSLELSLDGIIFREFLLNFLVTYCALFKREIDEKYDLSIQQSVQGKHYYLKSFMKNAILIIYQFPTQFISYQSYTNATYFIFCKKEKKNMCLCLLQVQWEKTMKYIALFCAFQKFSFLAVNPSETRVKHAATREINIRRIFGGGANISFIVLLKCTQAQNDYYVFCLSG